LLRMPSARMAALLPAETLDAEGKLM
jgi:hypothetical protein